MSEAQRLGKVEDKLEKLEKVFYKVEASLNNIEKNMSNALKLRDDVTTHTEKHKVTEARLDNLELAEQKTNDKINNINLRIAIATGGWGVIVFVINQLIGKII